MKFSFCSLATLFAWSALLCQWTSMIHAAPISERDVYVPHVLYPHAGVVWTAGKEYNVTWDISNPPKQITNPRGKIVLAKGNRLIGLANPLASDFDILKGWQVVTIPADTASGDDYSLVLFGDSGNNSELFTIVNDSESSKQ